MTLPIPDAGQSPAPRAPRLLYVGEFPPSNHHGGAILLRRLLDQHPAACLTVIASRLGMTTSQTQDLLSCRHITIPNFKLPGVLRAAAKALEVALAGVRTILQARQNRAEAIITIVQGRYYLAAAFAAWATATPHITIVHDNFLSNNIGPSGSVRALKRCLTRKILQHADHIYAVSPQMQRLVREECDVASEIQLPSTTAPVRPAASHHREREPQVVILFAGLIGYTVKDCLDLLIALIKSEQSALPGIQLHLCTSLTTADLPALGWDHKNVVCKGWLPQSALGGALASADILFLPYSFSEAAREAVETAFPSKTADYLAARKPLLIFGPSYSSLVRYAADMGFAEIVTEFSLGALAQGIHNIVRSRDYREQLATRALEVFSANHDIACQQRKLYATLNEIMNAPLPTSALESPMPGSH